jgi:chromatin remodeling complex protein RSC6
MEYRSSNLNVKKGNVMAKKKKAAAKRKPAAKKKSTAKRKSGLTQTTYSLSPELQAVVGSSKLTRPQIVKKLWVYIKAHKCQDTKNRRMIVPDKKLCEVIGKKPVDMLKLAGMLSKHIK